MFPVISCRISELTDGLWPFAIVLIVIDGVTATHVLGGVGVAGVGVAGVAVAGVGVAGVGDGPARTGVVIPKNTAVVARIQSKYLNRFIKFPFSSIG